MLYSSENRRDIIALYLYHLRVDQDLSQKEVAEKLNVGQSWVSKLEHNSKNISVVDLYRISKAFGIPFAKIAIDIEILFNFDEEDIPREVYISKLIKKHLKKLQQK